MPPNTPHSFTNFPAIQQQASRNSLILLMLSAFSQLLLLGGVFAGDAQIAGVSVFSLLELVFVVLLLANGYFIWRWCRNTDPELPVRSVSALCLAGLVLCFCGDVVNKNFAGLYFQYDSIIEHSYLIDSIVFFFPGYSLLLLALWVAVRDHLSSSFILRTLGLAAVVGLVTALNLRQPEMSTQALVMMTLYSMLICSVGVSAWWLLKAFGRHRILAIAVGAVLATVADAMIGQFWIADASYYPEVRYVNWIVYFTSQALLQLLPLRLARVEIEAEQAAQRG